MLELNTAEHLHVGNYSAFYTWFWIMNHSESQHLLHYSHPIPFSFICIAISTMDTMAGQLYRNPSFYLDLDLLSKLEAKGARRKMPEATRGRNFERNLILIWVTLARAIITVLSVWKGTWVWTSLEFKSKFLFSNRSYEPSLGCLCGSIHRTPTVISRLSTVCRAIFSSREWFSGARVSK